MAKNDAIAKVIAADPYLKERRAPTAADQQLYLKEVSFVCPLCGKILRHRGQRKTNKLYEIAHIFPNSPTGEQYERLKTLPRLGSDSESFENQDCSVQGLPRSAGLSYNCGGLSEALGKEATVS